MTTLSLEPSKLYAHDDHDLDLFATPARLHSVVLEDGSEVFTRSVPVSSPSLALECADTPLLHSADPKKSLQERLARVWAERGDYSQLTEERVLNPPEEDDGDKQDDDTRPSVEDIRKLQESMLKGLEFVPFSSSLSGWGSPFSSLPRQYRPGRAYHRSRPPLCSLSPDRPARYRPGLPPPPSANPYSRPDRHSPSLLPRPCREPQRRPPPRDLPLRAQVLRLCVLRRLGRAHPP